MSYATIVNHTKVQQWVINNFDLQRVQQELHVLGLDSESMEAHIVAFKKALHKKRLITGFILLGAGAFMGFLSCVLSIVNPIPSLYYWILYGFTSIAITVACWGMYYVLE